MQRALKQLLSNVLETARRGILRTPMEIFIGLATAAVLSFTIENAVTLPDDFGLKFGLAALPTLLAVFATSALYELEVIGAKRRWALTGAYIAGGIGYGVFLLDFSQQAELWRWIFLTSALGLGVLLTPLSARSTTLDTNELTWRFNVRLVIRTLLSGAYTALLTIGVVLGLLAFHRLFDIHVHDELFMHVAIWIFVAGGTWLLAAGLPEIADRETPISERLTGLIHRIGTWLFLPLLGLYMVILYAYGLRVLITGEAPTNVLSPLALGAAILGFVAMFFIQPLRRMGDKKWLASVVDKFPLAYLPIIPMPAWAIWVRIEQHGWTEFRYARLLAVAGITICCLYASWKKLRGETYSTAAMPAVFGVLAFLASFGPWGALEVSKRSQLSHLQADLAAETADEKTEEAPPGAAFARRSYRRTPTSDAASRVRYLAEHFGNDALKPILPEDTQEVSSVQEACDALEIECYGHARALETRSYSYNGPIRVDSAGTLHEIHYYGRRAETRSGDLTIDVDGMVLTAEEDDGLTHRVDLTDYVATLREKKSEKHTATLEADEAKVSMTSTATLYITHLNVRLVGPEEKPKIDYVTGRILVR